MFGEARFASRQIRFLHEDFLDPPCITQCRLAIEAMDGNVEDNEAEIDWSFGVNSLQKFHHLVHEDARVTVKIMGDCGDDGVSQIQLRLYSYPPEL